MASPHKNEDEEFVSVLKLNMLQDNPGAVKKVSGLTYSVFGLVEKTSFAVSLTQFQTSLFLYTYCNRNAGLEEASDPAKAKRQDVVTRDKRREPVDPYPLDLKADKQNSTSSFRNEDLPTSDTKKTCLPSTWVPFKITLTWAG